MINDRLPWSLDQHQHKVWVSVHCDSLAFTLLILLSENPTRWQVKAIRARAQAEAARLKKTRAKRRYMVCVAYYTGFNKDYPHGVAKTDVAEMARSCGSSNNRASCPHKVNYSTRYALYFLTM